MKVAVCNLGCKVNKYECDCIVTALRRMGHEVVTALEPADAYIVNTCAVTGEAERKSRQFVTRCLRQNPSATVAVIGCASQHDASPFRSKSGVTYIGGVADKAAAAVRFFEKATDVAPLPLEYDGLCDPAEDRTRAYIKVQDGCDNFCSYCLIPYLRGRSRSRALADCVAECEAVAARSREIVLTGIDLSSYGKNIGSSLAELIAALKDVDVRIRLGSLEVGVVDEKLLGALKGLKRFCPQFHLSLQSGGDAVLKRMNRHYTSAQYAAKVALIREAFPDAAVTTDLICGFPTETEGDFEQSLEFVESMRFAQVHVFGYSPRSGTVAAKLPQLPANVVEERVARAVAVAEKCKREFLSALVGKRLDVLAEQYEDGCTSGHSLEFVKAYIPGRHDGELSVTVKQLYKDGVIAE